MNLIKGVTGSDFTPVCTMNAVVIVQRTREKRAPIKLIMGPCTDGCSGLSRACVFLIPRSHSVRQYTHNQILTTLKIRQYTPK